MLKSSKNIKKNINFIFFKGKYTFKNIKKIKTTTLPNNIQPNIFKTTIKIKYNCFGVPFRGCTVYIYLYIQQT
jgi:hypothetical protein